MLDLNRPTSPAFAIQRSSAPAFTIGEFGTQAHSFFGLLKRRQERPSRHTADDWIDEPSHRCRNVTAQSNRLKLDINAAIPFHKARDAEQPPNDAMAFLPARRAVQESRTLLFPGLAWSARCCMR